MAIGILRRGDRIVMVQQHGPDGRPYWVLPGGVVEPGEFVKDALIREVKEEAGAEVKAIGPLALLSEIVLPTAGEQALVFVFEIAQWEGKLESQDPDGKVSDVELVTQEEVIRREEQTPSWQGIADPLVAYLRGEAPAGTMWFYREAADGQRLAGSLPPVEIGGK